MLKFCIAEAMAPERVMAATTVPKKTRGKHAIDAADPFEATLLQQPPHKARCFSWLLSTSHLETIVEHLVGAMNFAVFT
jgi:hypothetical protein